MRKQAKGIPDLRMLAPVYILLAILFAVLIRRGDMQLLSPAGVIADYQSKILWGALVFATIVGTTIIISFFTVIFRYHEDNHRKYEPSWTAGISLQLIAWVIPSIVIAVISYAVWSTAHTVDPYKPLASTKTPITIQVVALRWKWLFLYPYDGIATVNMMEIPAGTPVNLQLTADAPMNSFWVPRLSGQIYAMPGMVTQLHIQADTTGNFSGSAAEINGDGYAGMDFMVKAVSAADYQAWKSTAQRSTKTLDYRNYPQLAAPSEYVPPANYSLADRNLFHEVVMQFMEPGADLSTLQVRGKSL